MMKPAKLSIVYRQLSELKPYPGNARKHSAKSVTQLATTIDRLKCFTPISVDENDVILAGHGRYLAAQKLCLTVVPTISICHLNDAEKIAFRIADNRIAELSAFSKDALSIEFAMIREIDGDFDMEVTGFDIGTIELLIDLDAGSTVTADVSPCPEAGPAVTQHGDVWDLGLSTAWRAAMQHCGIPISL